MAELTDAMMDAAEARGRELLASEPRAISARLDQGRIVIDLANGCSYAVPASLIEDLQGATDSQLAQVEVDGQGFNLYWPQLDVDLYVPALIAGLFGTRRWMTRELARIAGSTSSTAKAAAARRNGASAREKPPPANTYFSASSSAYSARLAASVRAFSAAVRSLVRFMP